jgi:alkanesulfonate monooxygenase SsuD/methylene tetrahydromethanopterin reductase-like flavin-dependent oxidoreductase (luciferase family)
LTLKGAKVALLIGGLTSLISIPLALFFGVAAGYLRSEFNALGVDYDERNDLFDEALEVMRLALTEDAVAYEGRHFRSRGTTMRPRPVQQPCPPLWIGGNSLGAMLKAVAAADG